MNALYNEYLTGAEREAAIIIAESDARVAKLNVLFEAVDATLEANMLAAEAKVFAENGTYDDLTMLYREAAEEAATKKQGIIATLLEAIGNLFTKIGKFFTDKFGKSLENVPEGDTKLPKELETKVNIFKKAWNFIKSPFEKIAAGTEAGFSEDEIKKAWGQIAAEIGAVAATGTAVTMVIVKRETIIGWIKTVRDEIQNKIESAIKTLKVSLGIGKVVNDTIKSKNKETNDVNNPEKKNFGDKLLGVGQIILNKLKEFGGWISSWIGKLASALGLTKKQAEKEADAAPAQLPEGKENETNTNESVSLFGIDLDSDETFLESDISDDEYDELTELFNEL